MGPTPVDSPLEYLKPVVPHGFDTLICPEVECTAQPRQHRQGQPCSSHARCGGTLQRAVFLSKLQSLSYGISNEQPAVHRYVSVMKTRGHDVEAFRRGLVVDPSCPWLGASPDRLIFDPSETPMHGLLEVKCPYSQKGKSVSQIAEPFYMVKGHQDIFRLDRSHDYYFKVLGQMALAGLSWTDFAVFSDPFMIVERIRFCEQDWAVARPKLDNFSFLFCCLI
ncbi:hypothetical protein HPB48_000151 [Haemaphysalis longicornis]|uniref:YqaJ viral recombinase domain-containing protein n=1 Tax=Haemaphysalis longicornis TaxID=44386 RepID=A0A9J6G2B6_HAELO|nr:hypothetical protein HPB48_000151 [Haemaphysalis longicornis]